MRKRSESVSDMNAYHEEWSQWMREHGEWLDDVAVWDRQLRRLMILIHELDGALPYERQRLVEHHDAIKSHLKILESHETLLSGYGGHVADESRAHEAALMDAHHRHRYQHARVHDAHAALRHRHLQAMKQVDDLLDRFRRRDG